jgi:hypothetical protein
MVMKLSRRNFFTALLFAEATARATQTKALEAAVLEIFEIDGRTVAVLANHASPSVREQFAMWLRSRRKAVVRVRTPSGVETTAFLFRVRMCFGRALIVLHQPLSIREGDKLFIEGTQNAG